MAPTPSGQDHGGDSGEGGRDLLTSQSTAKLKALSVGNLKLSPAFAPGVRHYEASTCLGEGSVPQALAVDAEAEDEIALIGLTAPGSQTMGTGRVSANVVPWSAGRRPHCPQT